MVARHDHAGRAAPRARGQPARRRRARHAAARVRAWHAVRNAFRDRSFLLLHAGFFTCGFHIAFLVTHLPGEVDLCGLSPSVASWSLALIGLGNIAGSLIAGSGTAHYRSKYILALMYGSRALLIGWYLMAPKTEATFYIFAVGLGLTWLATAPPTADASWASSSACGISRRCSG